MGCDIHAHAEKKINGRWEHLQRLAINRNYLLFSTMVDGHSRSTGNYKGIAPERGIPDDANPLTKIFLDNIDCHTHSWLSGIELLELKKKMVEVNYDRYGEHNDYPFMNAWTYRLETDEDEELFDDDFRLVFAFDN